MISTTLKSIAQTKQSSSSDIASGYYAPLLKFTKYKGVSFHRNSRFLIQLLSVGGAHIRKSEIYITTGENYASPSLPTVKCFNMMNPEVDYILNEYDDCYILYVKTTEVGCVVHAQVLFCENISFVETYNFEPFEVDPNTLTKLIPQKIHYFPNLTPNVRVTNNGIGYYKIATLRVDHNTVGCTYAFSVCENQNGQYKMVGGDIYIKVRHINGSYPKVNMRLANSTCDFNRSMINIVAVAINSKEVEIYIHQPQAYGSYQIKDEFWNATANNSKITLNKPLFVETLPLGEQTALLEDGYESRKLIVKTGVVDASSTTGSVNFDKAFIELIGVSLAVEEYKNATGMVTFNTPSVNGFNYSVNKTGVRFKWIAFGY